VIVTPEQVETVLTPAGLGSRGIAVVVDGMVVLALCGVAAFWCDRVLPAWLAGSAALTAAFLITWSYHVAFEVLDRGRSPGKRLLGLRVVDGRGLPISPQQSFVRNVVRVLDFAPLGYGLGALVAQLDPHRRRLGDLAADTLVVAERRSHEPAVRALRSPEYNSLKTPRVLRLLRRRVSLEEREFLLALLLRSPELEGPARFALMEEAGRHFRQKLELGDELPLSGEALVRGLVGLLFNERR
jgi:uncharacterized RDD family membrane protein YckC